MIAVNYGIPDLDQHNFFCQDLGRHEGDKNSAFWKQGQRPPLRPGEIEA
jgi:hypothetical protein